MNRIKELRLSFSLTQTEMAGKIGVNQTAVGKYERGEIEPNFLTLKKLCEIFGCSVDYLLGFSDDFGNVTVYQQTDGINSLTAEEQKIIDALRRNTSINAGHFLAMYAELPTYMQESIFAELKGMHLGYTVSKKKKENL